MRIGVWSSDVCSSELERIAIDCAAQDLVSRGLAIWSSDGADRPVLIVRGQANLLDENAVGDLDRVRQLLDELETKQDIAGLLDSAREGAATRIFIGSENKLFSLSGSSVIAAPYRSEEHTSEIQSLMRISYAVFCLNKKKTH